MAKSKKDALKNQLRKGSVKKELLDTTEIEAITKKVYNLPPNKEEEIKSVEPIQRTTLDIPKSLHLAAKIEAMKDGKSLKSFILDLVRQELNQRGIGEF